MEFGRQLIGGKKWSIYIEEMDGRDFSFRESNVYVEDPHAQNHPHFPL